MRQAIFAILSFFIIAISGGASAQPWQSVDPAFAGWSVEKMKAAQHYATSLKPTAVMVVQDGKVIASWGDVSRKVNVASVRKSLLSALYGIAVSEGRIDLGSTLADLGIDDKRPALTATEKQATVRDLLMARSGIYHVAAYETADIRQKRPERGSHPPARSGSTTIGISTHSARSTGSRQARIFSGALHSGLHSRSACRIFPRGMARMYPNSIPFTPPIRFASAPETRRASASFILTQGAGATGRSFRRHG